MHDISIKENIYAENDHIAEHTNHDLTHKSVFALNVMGSPGAGKTSALEALIKELHSFVPVVVEGDIESDIDAVRFREQGVKAYQINTFGACHLDAPMLRNAVQNIDFHAPEEGGKSGSIVFIENVGNLVCPAEFSIGEHANLLISSAAEGSDKPYKYPLAFEKAGLILLTKTDLIPYVDFDEEYFTAGVRHLNPNVPIIRTSTKTGEGFVEAARLLESLAEEALGDHAQQHAHAHSGHSHPHPHSEK
jgi:hydrogenase nickel incorporation protein HypB